ncbi:MAG TPA: hypothetical protein VGE52_19860 [Pirellulales bacterium]
MTGSQANAGQEAPADQETPADKRPLAERFDYWRRVGLALAGGLREVAQRAAVYRQIFRDSGGNHIFPLIAAHGACWSRGYFAWGERTGWWLAWQFGPSRTARASRLAALDRFADVFRDVNRRVCAETYASYHFTLENGDDPRAARFVPPTLWRALRRMEAARRNGAETTTEEKRELFVAHFLYEQEYIVGPMLKRAVAEFDWPLVRWLSLRPTIRFAYFAPGKRLAFRDFSRQEERVEQGLKAFDWAAAAGWENVEARLADYDLLPERAFSAPDAHFADLCAFALAKHALTA